MRHRPAISVPLPWLAMLIGWTFGNRKRQTQGQRRRFKLPRTLSITKEGWWYIAALFVIGIAAINTGNNLLYLVAATLLSIIIISGVVSEHTLRRIKITRVMPRRSLQKLARHRQDRGLKRQKTHPVIFLHVKRASNGFDVGGACIFPQAQTTDKRGKMRLIYLHGERRTRPFRRQTIHKVSVRAVRQRQGGDA